LKYLRVREKLEKDQAPTNKDFKDFYERVGDPDDHPKIQMLLDDHPKGRKALVNYIKKAGLRKSALQAAETPDDEVDDIISPRAKRGRGRLPKGQPKKRAPVTSVALPYVLPLGVQLFEASSMVLFVVSVRRRKQVARSG